MSKKSVKDDSRKDEYIRVTLRGLTVPGVGVCSVGDLAKREYVPEELWDMVEDGQHPHMEIHSGPVDASKVRPHRPRGIMAVTDAPPPTPVGRHQAGRIVEVGGKVRDIDTGADDSQDLVVDE